MDDILKLQERILAGIELGESHFREFKSAYQRKPEASLGPRPLKDICRDIGEALVAFSNADGGELYVGVEDDGSITGIPHKQDHLEAMKSAYVNYVHHQTPLSSPSIKTLDLKDRIILYFQVAKSTESVHLTSDGRCLQRFDRENRPVPAERIQMDRQERVSLEYDRQFILNASLKDLDRDEIDGIINHLELGYSPEKFLQIFDLAEYSNGLKLKRAALLLFAKNVVQWHPRCSVRILRIRGNELGIGPAYNVSEDETIICNIVSLLDRAWDALKPHLARTKFQEDAMFREKIIYPEDACREALINAIAHRDYSIEGKPIEIWIFDDRMEVKSPGRLLSTISVQDLKELKGSHQSRNVFVSRVLRELGYMREMGEGIRRIYSSVRASDLVDPEILCDQNSFIVTLSHKSIFSEKDLQWLSSLSEFRLSKNEQRVVLLGRNGALLSTDDITNTLEIVDTKDFTMLYNRLNQKGIIFNTKPGIRSRRSMPRFQIRPPHETLQYLEELERSLYEYGPVEKFDQNIASRLKTHLSSNSPYMQNPLSSLRALEYISETNTPLPRATSIWSRSLRPRSADKEMFETDLIIGYITLKNHRGFGFAKAADGEEFYIHVSSLENKDDWELLEEGTRVEFRVGERNIAGKHRPAKSVKLLR